MPANASLLLNVNKIKSGELINIIPEFYELKEVIENNPWHKNETVFDHTISVLTALNKVLKNLDSIATKHLNEQIDGATKKDLLKIATLLHDIAKGETIVKKKDADTCPGHEAMGAKKAQKILSRLRFTARQVKFICDIIENHSRLHILLASDRDILQRDFLKFKKRFARSIFVELLLLALADTLPSYAVVTNPEDYKHRIIFYKTALYDKIGK
ncbi:MAG: HD domain-containing protein [Parcubacteria group bacterium]